MSGATTDRLGQIDRILVLGWGLIGDLFIRVPLIEALRNRFPDALITVVTDPESTVVLQNHPACNNVVPFSRVKKPAMTYLINTVKQILQLRRERFALCVNLYCGGGSPLVGRLVNARIRLCFDHTDILRRTNNLMVPRPSFCDNWTRDLGRMLVPLGIPLKAIRRGTSYYPSADAAAFAENFLDGAPRPLIAFNLGAGAAEKRWPVERFVELAIRINRHHHLIPLVFTNPGMEGLADEFVSLYEAHGEATHVPLVSIDRVAALMQKCDYVVSGDTALMHLAFGLNRPTLALFTYTRPQTVAPEDTPHVCCFVAGDSETDACGNPMGTAAIPLDEAYLQFSNLVTFVSKNTASC